MENLVAIPPGIQVTTLYDTQKHHVVEVVDTGIFPLPEAGIDFFSDKWNQVSSTTSSSAPIATSSIQVEGNEIRWKQWRFHHRYQAREGLILSLVGIEDKGQFRPILYRASLSERLVPYGDPDKQWFWRCAFDEGEYGIGTMGNSLVRGVHFPNDGIAFEALFADETGELQPRPAVVAMYERDGDLLWSHSDDTSKEIAARRGKELVLVTLFTVGNYDYGMQWIFREDGTLELQMLLTGVILTKTTSLTQCERCKILENPVETSSLSAADTFGSLVAKNLVGVIHQHFFQCST